ncbi:MAG: hydrogenase expression/formation protein HypE [Deltaproteobacteria bacterium]|jgi:hydrogenase expression/formation protein HypE|nr:hydrogenase expression/formation protein HypE [Deltaproteobacteria bacterium]
MNDCILLDAGSGGRATRRLIRDLFLRHFHNPSLEAGNDAALLPRPDLRLAMSTDSHTVHPLFFPGGDIGRLAVCGTVNDVAMLGARPRWLSAAFIIEEGLEYGVLEDVVRSMAQTATACAVEIVTGDTKVVPKGACDRLFVTTTGLGEVLADPAPSGNRAQPGDAIIISGPIGAHGLAVLGARSPLPFLSGIASDCAPVHHLVPALLEAVGSDGALHVLRDPTRGGLATAVNEIAEQSGVSCLLDEASIPVDEAVQGGCAVLGLDPLYLGNEGCLVCLAPENLTQAAIDALRGRGCSLAARIGAVLPLDASAAGQVRLRTRLGGQRLLPMLESDPLPRIC